MKRREFIGLVGGAVAIPVIAAAQQRGRVRRIGALMTTTAIDPEGQGRIATFRQGLQALGWIEGENVLVEPRWAASDAALDRRYASELVAMEPDVILATGSSTVAALQSTTSTVPIVFAHAIEPVGAGFVDSLARPGGNITGFLLFEYGISAKWLELLKQIAPSVTRVGVVRDPAMAAGTGQFGAIQAVAASFGVDLTPINVTDANQIERTITQFARQPYGGVIVTASPLAFRHRELLVSLAAQHKLCAVYNLRAYVTAGGLISYGSDIKDLYRRAAGYVDCILRGEKPADLPVQAPIKFEIAINMKAAKALGISLPTSLLALADDVIE